MLRAFLITIIVILAGAAALVFTRVDLAAVWAGHRSPALLVIGATPVRIPGAYLRPDDQAQTFGEANLIVAWPSFKPPLPAADSDAERIFLTLAPADPDKVERNVSLYARFFEGEGWSNPGGLIMRRFRTGSPYQDEELYFAPPEGEAFLARCPKQGSSMDIGQQNCIWLFRAHGIDIQVRFSATLLPQWTRLNDGIRGLIGEWAAAGGNS